MKRLTNLQSSSARPSVKKNRRRGAALVEFAILTPVIFLFIFGAIEFGRMLMVQHSLSDAARDACRQASLATITSSEDVKTRAKERLASVIPNADAITTVTVSPTWGSISGIPGGTPIKVTITVDHDRVSWLPAAQLIRKDGMLTGEANMKRE